MRIAAFAAVAAFVFASGSVSAADPSTTNAVRQFSTLNGVKAVPMSSAELNAVKGMDHHFQVNAPNVGLIDPNNSSTAKPFNFNATGTVERFGTDWLNEEENSVALPGNTSVAPSYLGFSKASCNGVILVPGFATCL